MPFNGSVRGTFGSQGKFIRTSINNGLSSSSPFTNVSEIRSASNSGLYWIRTTGMVQARQFYIDTNNTNGPSSAKWIRILLPSGFNYSNNVTNEDVDSWINSDVPALIDSMTYFMYAFINTSNNTRTQSWYFEKPTSNVSDFRNLPPTKHGSEGSPLITQISAVRMQDGSSVTSYLRSGISSFGGICDDGRSSLWGQICLKAGNTPNTGSGGYLDFPQYATFSVNTTSPSDYATDCTSSNEQYNNIKCSSSRQFAVYVA